MLLMSGVVAIDRTTRGRILNKTLRILGEILQILDKTPQILEVLKTPAKTLQILEILQIPGKTLEILIEIPTIIPGVMTTMMILWVAEEPLPSPTQQHPIQIRAQGVRGGAGRPQPILIIITVIRIGELQIPVGIHRPVMEIKIRIQAGIGGKNQCLYWI
jgi:hypothetical protein